MINVSTACMRGVSASVASRELMDAGMTCIELSAGNYSETLLEDLQGLTHSARFQMHNYFPPPAQPFVLNLGSLDAGIGARSVAHVKEALEWCKALGCERYSFHAGFLLDPGVGELGKKIAARPLYDREASIDKFAERVVEIAAIAGEANVMLMIENNVLSAKNKAEFGCNPLLMCEPLECAQIMDRMPRNVGMLLDVAHLKVSANSLGFDPAEMFERCGERIAGYHLSDNDGLEDSNRPFDEDAWFWPYLDPQADYFTIEVYGCDVGQLRRLSDLMQQQLSAAGDLHAG